MIAHNALRWTPRILAILFTLFISIFALDVFSEGYSFSELLTALLIHLTPTIALAGLTYLAWKQPRVGGSLFLILSILTIFAFDTYEQLPAFLTITVVPFITGVLFLLTEDT